MTEPQAKKPPIVVLTERVKSLEGAKVTYVAATVVEVHPLSSTFDVAVGDEGLRWAGISSPPHFLPAVGDVVQLSMSGALPTYQPGRVAEGAIGDDELSGPVKEQITTAYETATGKNKVYFSTATPTEAGISGTAEGDLWFQEDVFGLGLVVGAWEWVGTEWAARKFNDSVLNSLAVGKLVSGTGTFDMLMAGSIYSNATGSRYRIDSTGIKLFSGSSTTPTVDLNAITGNATFRGTVEGALIRTSATGQRLEIQGGGTAGGRTMTFYPATGTGVATFTSRDDGAGNAGLTLKAGGANRGFLNFNSTFADLGYGNDTSASAWVRANPGSSTFGLEMTSTSEISSTTWRTRWFDGAYTYAILSRADGLNKVGKFSLLGPADTGAGSDVGAFTFGQMPGGSDADVYALRFISTNAGGTGGFIYFSDRRLKEKARAVTFDALSEVLSMPVEEFVWKSTGEKSFGFQAQNMPADVQVQLSPDGPIDGVDNPVGVASELVMAKLVKAVQQLDAKVESMRGRVL